MASWVEATEERMDWGFPWDEELDPAEMSRRDYEADERELDAELED